MPRNSIIHHLSRQFGGAQCSHITFTVLLVWRGSCLWKSFSALVMLIFASQRGWMKKFPGQQRQRSSPGVLFKDQKVKSRADRLIGVSISKPQMGNLSKTRHVHVQPLVKRFTKGRRWERHRVCCLRREDRVITTWKSERNLAASYNYHQQISLLMGDSRSLGSLFSSRAENFWQNSTESQVFAFDESLSFQRKSRKISGKTFSARSSAIWEAN